MSFDGMQSCQFAMLNELIQIKICRGTDLAEFVGFVEDVGFEFEVGDVAVDSVPDAEEFVGVENDEFRIGHEDFGRLVVLDGQNEGVDGVAKVNHVRFRLVTVKIHHIAVVFAELQ